MLESIVEKIPAPSGSADEPLKCLIFDSLYDSYKGVIVFLRVFDGSVKSGDKVRFMAPGRMKRWSKWAISAPAVSSPAMSFLPVWWAILRHPSRM